MCCSVCSSDSELVGHHVVVSVDLFPAHLNVWCRLWIVSDRIFVTNLTFSSAVANVLLSYASSDARWCISCAQAECCLCAHREAHQRERRRPERTTAASARAEHGVVPVTETERSSSRTAANVTLANVATAATTSMRAATATTTTTTMITTTCSRQAGRWEARQ